MAEFGLYFGVIIACLRDLGFNERAIAFAHSVDLEADGAAPVVLAVLVVDEAAVFRFLRRPWES